MLNAGSGLNTKEIIDSLKLLFASRATSFLFLSGKAISIFFEVTLKPEEYL